MTDIEVQSIDRSKLLFLLDPGHGIDTKGKRSPGKKTPDDGKPGIVEYEFNRDIVNRIIRIATSRGIQAVDLVVQQESIPLKERVRRANEINETHRCAFISVHANAAVPKASGVRTFTRMKPTPASQWWAETLVDHISDETGLKNLGTKDHILRPDKKTGEMKKVNLGVLKGLTMPGALTENGFMTNHEDCKILESDDGRERIAAAHVAAMADFVEWSG